MAKQPNKRPEDENGKKKKKFSFIGKGRSIRKSLYQKELCVEIRRIKMEMEEIRKEHERIKEPQRHILKKYQTIEADAELLRRDTEIIKQQSANTQLRLALMFQILKAREKGDFDLSARLTQVLREIIAAQVNIQNGVEGDARAGDIVENSSVGSNDPAQHSSVASNDPGEARERVESSSVGSNDPSQHS